MNFPTKAPATAQEALKRLKEGNERFTKGIRSVESIIGIHKLKDLAENGQSPYCIIVCCSDSRATVETIFDCGLGEMFVIRVAGNTISPAVVASIEFAAGSLGSPLCILMGHSRCGAITAAVNAELGGAKELSTPNLDGLLKQIRPAVRVAMDHNPGAQIDTLKRHTCAENVRRGMRDIMESSVFMRDLVGKKQIEIVGAVFDLDTGVVNFMNPSEDPRVRNLG